MTESTGKHWTKAKAIIALMFCLGAILMLIAIIPQIGELHMLSEFLIHLGTALVVAAAVGAFLEVGEMQEFFEHRLMKIISSDGFVDLMSEQQLTEFAVTASSGLGRKRVNNPTHEYEDFALAVGHELLEHCGRQYRRDLLEVVDIYWLSDEELKSLGGDPSVMPADVARITQKMKYELVSPNAYENQRYTVLFASWFEDTPGWDSRNHTQFELAVDGKKIDVDVLKFFVNRDGHTVWDLQHEITYRGKCTVEATLKTIEVQANAYGSTLGCLTKNANVHFNTNEDLDIDAQIMGMTGDAAVVSTTNNSVSMQFTGWLLSGQGYFLSWRRKRSRRLETAVDRSI